jgi:DNA-directed RNA polymerase subunit alpha
VSELEISVRTKNALATLNCKTLGDVVQHSMFDLLKARHIGKKSLVEIDELVNEYGLHWGMRLNG